jgi:hypothetical protein
MPNFKIVYQYTQPNKGWTETFYRTATDLPTAATQLPQVYLRALFMRDTLTVLNKIRISDVLNNRSSLVVPVNVSGPPGSAGPEGAGVAALVNLVSTTPPSSRKLWVRGIQDLMFNRIAASGVDNPSAGLINAINDWITYLAQYGYTIRSLAKVGAPPNNYITINSVGVVSPGSVNLNVTAGAVLATGQQIVVNQVNQKLFPGLKGIFSVGICTATVVPIPYNSTMPIAIYPLTKGRFRQVNYNYGAISVTGSGFSNFSTRSTGKNPLGGRGARRGQRGFRSQ